MTVQIDRDIVIIQIHRFIRFIRNILQHRDCIIVIRLVQGFFEGGEVTRLPGAAAGDTCRGCRPLGCEGRIGADLK